MLDKKQIQAIFLSSKWIVKQWRQLTTSTMHVAQELQMNGQCSGGLRSSAKETRALNMRSTVAGHWKLTTTRWEDPEKAMATHSSTLAWRIPGMAEPGGLSSMGLHRVGHDWSDLAAAAVAAAAAENKTHIQIAVFYVKYVKSNNFPFT